MTLPREVIATTLQVAAATAAEVENRSADVELLCSDIVSSSTLDEAHAAALCISRTFLTRSPSPMDVVASFPGVARERFSSEVGTVGLSYLRTASLPESAELKRVISGVVGASRMLGELVALRGAVASSWWALYSSAELLGTDPLSDARRLCLELAALEGQS